MVRLQVVTINHIGKDAPGTCFRQVSKAKNIWVKLDKIPKWAAPLVAAYSEVKTNTTYVVNDLITVKVVHMGFFAYLEITKHGKPKVPRTA
jgi:hypothetical protein